MFNPLQRFLAYLTLTFWGAVLGTAAGWQGTYLAGFHAPFNPANFPAGSQDCYAIAMAFGIIFFTVTGAVCGLVTGLVAAIKLDGRHSRIPPRGR